jgi:hypothetical protein
MRWRLVWGKRRPKVQGAPRPLEAGGTQVGRVFLSPQPRGQLVPRLRAGKPDETRSCKAVASGLDAGMQLEWRRVTGLFCSVRERWWSWAVTRRRGLVVRPYYAALWRPASWKPRLALAVTPSFPEHNPTPTVSP